MHLLFELPCILAQTCAQQSFSSAPLHNTTKRMHFWFAAAKAVKSLAGLPVQEHRLVLHMTQMQALHCTRSSATCYWRAHGYMGQWVLSVTAAAMQHAQPGKPP
jgi:hypothetical protein